MDDMRTYTKVMDDSTGYDEVVRIEDDGTLVENVRIYDADRHMVQMLGFATDARRAAERNLADALEAEQKALYVLTQHVWSKRAKPSGEEA